MQRRIRACPFGAAVLWLASAPLAGQETGDTAPSLIATTVAQPRPDANSELAHAQLVKKAGAGIIDVYFIGDSITRRWGALDYPELLASFESNFFGWNAANFGWGGDRTQNILWRLDNGELEGVMPKVFIVQAGTNNLGDFDNTYTRVAAVAAGIVAIVERCRRHAPDALVVVTGLFPRRDRPELNPSIEAINEQLAAYAAEPGIRYLGLNEPLADARGLLRESMSEDGLHLSSAAYQIWADALKPVLAARLGPPADRDRAPPPTGNPGAQ